MDAPHVSQEKKSGGACGMCALCNSMPPWAPERVALLSPAERTALYARMEAARQRFLASRPIIASTSNSDLVEVSLFSTAKSEKQPRPSSKQSKPHPSESRPLEPQPPKPPPSETQLSETQLSESQLSESQLSESQLSEPRLPELQLPEPHCVEPQPVEPQHPDSNLHEPHSAQDEIQLNQVKESADGSQSQTKSQQQQRQQQQQQRHPGNELEAKASDLRPTQEPQPFSHLSHPLRPRETSQPLPFRMSSLDVESDADSYYTADSDADKDQSTVPPPSKMSPSIDVLDPITITPTKESETLQAPSTRSPVTVPTQPLSSDFHSPDRAVSNFHNGQLSDADHSQFTTLQSAGPPSDLRVRSRPSITTNGLEGRPTSSLLASPLNSDSQQSTKSSAQEQWSKDRTDVLPLDGAPPSIDDAFHILALDDIDGTKVDSSERYNTSLTGDPNISSSVFDSPYDFSSTEIKTIDLNDAFDDNIEDSRLHRTSNSVDAHSLRSLNSNKTYPLHEPISGTASSKASGSPEVLKSTSRDPAANNIVCCSDCQAWRRRVQDLETQVEAQHAAIVAREMEITSLRARLENGSSHSSKSEPRLLQECRSLRLTVEFLVSLPNSLYPFPQVEYPRTSGYFRTVSELTNLKLSCSGSFQPVKVSKTRKLRNSKTRGRPYFALVFVALITKMVSNLETRNSTVS